MAGVGQALPSLEGCIYLDYNATTPVFPQVAEAMVPYLTTHFGNPSSIHTYGRKCKAAVDTARQQVATLLHAQPDEIVFTACGTESDNWAIYGSVMAARQAWGPDSGRVPHVVCSVIEHPAVLVYLQHMKDQGLLDYTMAACDNQGLIEAQDVLAAITHNTVLVTIMHSNNEVGSLQPIAGIAAAVAQHNTAHNPQPPILVHTDAAQSIGKVPIHVDELGVDMATVVGHKFGAPKGIAALYVKKGVKLPNYLHGGGQESGRRAGTENVLLQVGLGAAAAIVTDELHRTSQHMQSMRDRLEAGIRAGLHKDAVAVNGPPNPSQRLPNTLSIAIRGLKASQALTELKDQLAASAGAACHSSGSSISSVLKAMNVPVDLGVGTLRLSTGRHTTTQEIDAAVKLLIDVAQRHGVPAASADDSQSTQLVSRRVDEHTSVDTTGKSAGCGNCGSSRSFVEVIGTPLDIKKYTDSVSDPGAGAITTFTGVTRNNFNGKEVVKLDYEAYAPMAVKKLQEICDVAHSKWQLIKVAIAHRTGEVAVEEPSVIIAASSAHRREALEAVHWLIDELKAVVPIWKKEFFSDGSQWKENAESRLLEQAQRKAQLQSK